MSLSLKNANGMIYRINTEEWDTEKVPEKQIRAEMYFYYKPEDIVRIFDKGQMIDKLRLDELFDKPKNKKWKQQ